MNNHENTPVAEDNIKTLLYYLNIINKSKWFIIIIMIIIPLIVYLRTTKQSKLYMATASIIIEAATPQIIDEIKSPNNQISGYYSSSREFYQTEYIIIHTRAIAKKVIDKLGLWKNPEYLNISDTPGSKIDFKKYDPESILLSQYTVIPDKDSKIVYIRVINHDPKTAALIANTIVNEYMEFNLEKKYYANKEADNWLREQLYEMIDKLEKSEYELYYFKKDNDIMSVTIEDNQSITSTKMKAISDQMTRLEVKKIELEAKINTINKVTTSDNNYYDAIDFLLDNDSIRQLKTNYKEADNRFTEISEKYKNKHPMYIAAKLHKDLLQDDLKQAINRVLNNINAEYAYVCETYRILKESFEELKNKNMELSKKEIELNRLKRESENNNYLYNIILKKQKENDIMGMVQDNNIKKLDEALVPKSPFSPNVRYNVVLSIVISMAGSIGIILLINYFDNTIKTKEDIEKYTKANLLGIIPMIKKNKIIDNEKDMNKFKDTYILTNPNSTISEACRSIRTNIMYVNPEKKANIILITSSGPREGKSMNAVSIAISMAISGMKTLLIDCDMRKPRLHMTFEKENEKGLSNYIIGLVDIKDVIHTNIINNLDLLTSGPIPPNPSELLHTKRFEELKIFINNNYQKVIIDSPPINAVTDALILSKYVDGTIIIIKSGATTREMANNAINKIINVESNILGVVLNEYKHEEKSYRYYRKYGGYYYTKKSA